MKQLIKHHNLLIKKVKNPISEGIGQLFKNPFGFNSNSDENSIDVIINLNDRAHRVLLGTSDSRIGIGLGANRSR